MNKNPLIGLKEIGQSVWLDNLSRKLIHSGELQRLIAEDGMSGVTSNPTIFQKAISGSADYDSSLRKMIERGVRDEKELVLGLAIEDVSDAADLLRPTYRSTNGQDGFVSIEVSPDLAYETDATISEARRLFSTIGRKNILVKVPGTKQGLPAIEQLTSEGVNVNVTLLFSTERYEEVAEAYLKGLERRASKGQPINEIASVASFFVSRVDTLTDKLLDVRLSAARQSRKRQRSAHQLQKIAPVHGIVPLRSVQRKFPVHQLFEMWILGQLFQSAPVLFAGFPAQLLPHRRQIQPMLPRGFVQNLFMLFVRMRAVLVVRRRLLPDA